MLRCAVQENQVREIVAAKHSFNFIKCYTMNKYKQIYRFIYVMLMITLTTYVYAQDGNAGINEANTKVRSYFASGVNLMYAVGAIVGLIGAVKVYQKWNSGDHDTGKVASAWFGSCVFLVIVATVLRSFFAV